MKATNIAKLQLSKDTLLRLSHRELHLAAAQTGLCIVQTVTTPRVKCC